MLRWKLKWALRTLVKRFVSIETLIAWLDELDADCLQCMKKEEQAYL